MFEKKNYRLDLDFTPKKNFGCVSHFSNDILPSTFADILDLPADKVQKSLNDLCYKMWKQAENTNGKFLENKESNWEKLKELFSLQEKAIPVLQQQEYVYRHPFYWARYLKGRETV